MTTTQKNIANEMTNINASILNKIVANLKDGREREIRKGMRMTEFSFISDLPQAQYYRLLELTDVIGCELVDTVCYLLKK